MLASVGGVSTEASAMALLIKQAMHRERCGSLPLNLADHKHLSVEGLMPGIVILNECQLFISFMEVVEQIVHSVIWQILVSKMDCYFSIVI